MIRNIFKILSLTYIAALIWILIFKFGIWTSVTGNIRRVNLIPYNAPVILNGKADAGEMILNVLVFVPLGLYTGILFKEWSVAKKILLFFMVSFIIEAIQFIMIIGAFDITDIINNVLGGIAGLVIIKVTGLVFKNPLNADKFIALISATGTVLFIAVMLYVKFSNRFIFK